MDKIDNLDKKILSILSKNARIPFKDVAAECGVSRAAIHQRVQHLMENGVKVEGGDRLGKTIIFAVNQNHAQFIADRFNENYPKYDGKFARVITHSTKYAQSLIDDDDIPHEDDASSRVSRDNGAK